MFITYTLNTLFEINQPLIRDDWIVAAGNVQFKHKKCFDTAK